MTESNPLLTIRVRRIQSEDCLVSVSPSSTVAQLKETLFTKTGIAASSQRLIYQGRLMDDSEPLSAYHVEEGHVIHLVESPQNPNPEPTSEPESEDDMLNEIVRGFTSRLSVRNANRRFLFQQNAQALMSRRRFNLQESLEVLRQNICSLQSFHGALSPVKEENVEKPFEGKKMVLKLGQWVDVKDTIDQWLEAQVTKIREGRVFVHYNGWGNHWDEWIDCDSSRIAPFRTYTLQYPSSRYLSPAPNIPTDSEDHEIPPHATPHFGELLSQATNLIERLHTSLKTFSAMEEGKIAIEAQKRQVAAQLAPLLDRTGRLLCDFAPHFAHLADPEQYRDEPLPQPLTYQSDRPEFPHDRQIPLMANPGDVSVVSNLLDRVIFGDSPSLEVHVHAFLNPPSQSDPRPQSVSPIARRPLPPSIEPIQSTVETETQTEPPPMCDSAIMTDNILTHTSVGVQAGMEDTKKAVAVDNKEIAKSPIRSKIKAHVGHTIIRESPRIAKGKYANGEFRITKTSLKMGPCIRRPDHK